MGTGRVRYHYLCVCIYTTQTEVVNKGMDSQPVKRKTTTNIISGSRKSHYHFTSSKQTILETKHKYRK